MKILKIIGKIIFGLFVLGVFLIFYSFRNEPDPSTCTTINCENCLTGKQLKGTFQCQTSRSFITHHCYKCVDCQADSDCQAGFGCFDNKCQEITDTEATTTPLAP